jgi:hypothetical protein
MKTLLRIAIATACLNAATSASAQDAAFTNRATELKDKAAFEGLVIIPLPADTPVKVLARSSGWTRVEVNGKTGWVRVFHLRFPASVEAGSSSSSGGFLGGLTSSMGFGGKPKQDGTKLATVGIRGLSEEDMKNASPNPEALKKMQSYRIDKASAERFAKDGKLVTASVEYTDDSGAPASPSRSKR